MKQNVIVRKSGINKKGVFAGKNFRKGEVVLKWNFRILTKSEVGRLPKRLKRDIDRVGENRYILHQPPERFLNHSCEPNTKAKSNCDIAVRNIKKGEEITSDYGKGILTPFKCRCGSKNCRKMIA